MFNKYLYIPRPCIIKEIKNTSNDTKLFRIVFKDKRAHASREDNYKPGQFVQFSILGAGEVPISIASSPTQKAYLEFLVRKIGVVTSAIHELKVKDEIGIRGPYGNYFPIEDMKGKNLIFVGGGCGLAPLRSVINYVLDKRKDYGDITILYGARTRDDLIFKDEIGLWRAKYNFKVHLTVDCGPIDPGCSIGVVTTLFNRLEGIRNQKIFICGPSIMLHFAIKGLLELGAEEDNIFVTLERYMKCGVGKCGHCYIATKYVCSDGPVFSLRNLRELGTEA
jgi:NAD(P)H-flavin reductase